MISVALAAIGGWFRTNPRNVWIIAGLIAAVLFLLWVRHTGVEHQKKVEAAHRRVEVAAALASDEKADTKGEAQAVTDAVIAANAKERLVEVIAEKPDGVPDAQSVRYGCEQLSIAGYRPADLPRDVAALCYSGTQAAP